MDNLFAIWGERTESFTPGVLGYSNFQVKGCEVAAAVETLKKVRINKHTVCSGILALEG